MVVLKCPARIIILFSRGSIFPTFLFRWEPNQILLERGQREVPDFLELLFRSFLYV